MKTLIINKVLPDNTDGQFFQKRKKLEQTYLDMIEEVFNRQEKLYVPLFPNDIMTPEQLETYSRYLVKEETVNESFST